MAIVACIFNRHVAAQPYLDNQTLYSNQDPNTETRRSDHFRICFGHFNRDTGTPVTEALAQGNLQMFEQMWNRWVIDMGLHDINVSATAPDGNKYRANFNVLMSWNDGGGGGAFSTMDSKGFFYAMANSGYCRYDPPSGATPHEFGHVWEGTCAGFNGSDSSGSWWECTANWMQLQFLNSYPQAGAYINNPMYYPAHGRDYYDSFMIWETAREHPGYGAAWVNNVWTNATASQRTSEFIIDRMIRCDTSGSADRAGAVKDLWGDMAKKMVTWDFERQRWLATANAADDGSNWEFYQRCRTPLLKVPDRDGWFRPARAHLPMEFGFNIIPLTVTNNTTVSCNFQGLCDPVRQSDWRACLVAVNNAGDASYSSLWNAGVNSIALSADQARCYLVVIATPKPMKIAKPEWRAYLTDPGRQFPYEVSFYGATPKNVIYPPQSRTGMTQHPNGGGWKATTATVDATAYVGPNAQVLDTAQVRGSARIEDYAVVRNSAQVRDYAVVSGRAVVQGNAKVYGNAKVRDWARVFGYAEVYDNARVIEHGNCGDGNATTHTHVYGSAAVKGTTYVYDPSKFAGSLIVDGDSANGNGSSTAAISGVHFGWSWGQDPARFAGLTNNNYLWAQHTFEKDNAVFALDEYGINHGLLINGCRATKDTDAPTRGGLVLALNGTNQYVELHNTVNDFKDSTYAVWFKCTGSNADQRVWCMGDGQNKAMELTQNDSATGGLRFRITDGLTTHVLDAGLIPPNTWTHVAVVFSGATCPLYVNGSPAATLGSISIFPEDLNAPFMENANYLGRGNTGGFFAGMLDDFRVYSKALTAAEVSVIYAAPAPAPVTIAGDTTAPTPNPPTWLVTPRALDDSTVTMSATSGTDASGWVEYYFACTSGPGHDSGWVSFNKYNDVGVTPGFPVSYSLTMRDRNGNTTAPSAPGTAICTPQGFSAAAFSYGPIGAADGRITMSAAVPTNSSGKLEYRFDRVSPLYASSGWQSSRSWTDTGLAANATCTYTVTLRAAGGNVSNPSAVATALARDDAPPLLPMAVAHWEMQPYATIDNKISMTAMAATDASGMEYRFRCLSGGGPDSSWQASRTFLTAALADGTYSYQYQVRDTSPQRNTSEYSGFSVAKITRTTGYHSYTLGQVLTNADDYLVSFTGTVMRANSNNYLVKDLAAATAIKVRPSTSNEVTNPSLVFKNVQVKGHLYTFGGTREVTYATVSSNGLPALYTISGRVTNSAGLPVAGATVSFSEGTNASASPVVTATTDASGNYSRTVTVGTWYIAATAPAYNTSADRKVTIVSSGVTGLNFGLIANARVQGRITRRSDGTPVSGASVYFSRQPGGMSGPIFTASTDIAGNYSQAVQDGTWYVYARASGYYPVPEKMVTVAGVDVGGIDFALQSSARTVPQSSNLLFSVITDSLPTFGNTGPWPTYLPAGHTLSTIGSPAAEVIQGITWEKNLYADGDGYNQARYAAPIACSGMTIIAAARPTYYSVGGEPRGEIVDIFYDRLALAVGHADGKLMVARGKWNDWGPVLPNGQSAVLSLVVQTNGTYRAYANGAQVMTGTAYGDFTSVPPDHTVAWGTYTPWTSDADFTHYVSVGRNAPDGWSTFNGNIGDVFVYTTALPDLDRLTVEADLNAKFRSTNYTITVSAGGGGYVNPGGTVLVYRGGTQTFTMTPLPGYAVSNVVVNGSSYGPVSSYTFNSILGNQSLSAYFTQVPPVLSIARTSSGAVEISWPQSYSAPLVSSPVLGPGAVWSITGLQPVASNGVYRVSVSPSSDAAFYRLGL